MHDVKSREIAGRTYTFYHQSPMKQAKVFTRLVKLVGKPISEFMKGLDPTKGIDTELSDISPVALGDAFKELLINLDEDQMVTTLKDLLDSVHIAEEGKTPRQLLIEKDFTGRFLEMLQVAWVSIEVHYLPFMGGDSETGGLDWSALMNRGLQTLRKPNGSSSESPAQN